MRVPFVSSHTVSMSHLKTKDASVGKISISSERDLHLRTLNETWKEVTSDLLPIVSPPKPLSLLPRYVPVFHSLRKRTVQFQ